MFFELLALFGALLFILYLSNTRPKNAPPGPICFPLVGSIPLFGLSPDKTMSKWQKMYGDTYSFRIGQKLVIMLNNFETIRKMLGDERTTGRDPTSLFSQQFVRNDIVHVFALSAGVAFSQNQLWKDHRRFAISTLRDLGMGQSWLGDAVSDEVADFCKELTDTKGQPVDPRHLLSHSVSNIISAMVLGERFSHSDKRFTKLASLVSESLRDMARVVLVEAVPILKHFPGIRGHWDSFLGKQAELLGFLKELIKGHGIRKSNDGANDYIAAFKKEAADRKLKNDEQTAFDEFQLSATLFDLFNGGTETTAMTMTWALLFLQENPEVLRKVREEMNEICSPDKPVTMSERALLPYTEATLLEVQRLATLVPLNVPHQTFTNLTIDGYDIPKGSLIMSNIYFVHRDPRYWQNPERFDPTRFLDDQGKVTKPDGFMPFSIGKRACIGESLAKMELWLFFTNVLHRFDVKLPPGQRISSDEYDFGLTRAPKPFKLIFVQRR